MWFRFEEEKGSKQNKSKSNLFQVGKEHEFLIVIIVCFSGAIKDLKQEKKKEESVAKFTLIKRRLHHSLYTLL